MSTNVFDHFITVTGIKQIVNDASPSAIIVTFSIVLAPLLALLILALSQRPSHIPPPAGCRKLGLQGRSNLEDQYSKKYAKGADPTPAKPWTVKALFIYPLKSCAPVELEKSEIVRTGLSYDRQFALGHYVTSLPSTEGKVTSEWHFMTQRKYPRLAKVETEIWVPDPSAKGYQEDGEWVKSEGCLVVRFPFSPDTDFTVEGLLNYGKILAAKLARKAEPMLEFRVPFNPQSSRIKSKGYKNEVLRIWKDNPVALNMSSEVDPEILSKLGYTLGTTNPIALFRIDTNKYREVHKCAPKVEDVGFQTVIGMQDSYPIHIINLASVHHVAENLPGLTKSEYAWQNYHTLLNALRFRANIYITGPPAFHEDNWTKAKTVSPANSTPTTYHISCRTTRCKLPNVDPETGIADRNEPMTTMRKYRVIDEGSKSACLGMQVTPLGDGEVKVGDSIEVLETGKHFFLGGEGSKVDG
ncbi:uncharacterized protein K460DRAFT_287477 [Cucurbitaria berberidis CBS 394.84]|uniref:MOSC domain-containing protein n=1 Tax=Cucurbitaria berberidis CBS 394.84 TaxID=1168544 RepID=A0A9P4GDF7_9PLEO|nr:uncharacterized protein K460DRAFT_287477 [Cucurbitaria berberidis CBS 394.84]KAF1843464.1 hypothetical protein K460DRAFT_287477 [Cucurbitaria berberidis CBS 394.84]